MKIICQYPCSETDTTIFSLPETAMGRTGQPLFLPDETGRISALPLVVTSITRLGKHVAERFAHRYYNSWSAGLLFIMEERWQRLRSGALPWHGAFDCDGVLRVGSYMPFDPADIRLCFTLSEDKEEIYDFNAHEMQLTFDALLHRTSEYSTIRQGDLLACCITSQPFPVTMESKCKVCRNEEELLRVKLK